MGVPKTAECSLPKSKSVAEVRPRRRGCCSGLLHRGDKGSLVVCRRWAVSPLKCGFLVIASAGLLAGVIVAIMLALWDFGPDRYTVPSAGNSSTPVFVTVGELAGLRRAGAVILDARNSVDSYIPGAVHAPWRSFVGDGGHTGKLLDAQSLQAKFRALGVRQDQLVVVYGGWDRVAYRMSISSSTWGEEGRLFWTLHYLNHTGVRCLYGGMNSWQVRRERIALVGTVSVTVYTSKARPHRTHPNTTTPQAPSCPPYT